VWVIKEDFICVVDGPINPRSMECNRLQLLGEGIKKPWHIEMDPLCKCVFYALCAGSRVQPSEQCKADVVEHYIRRTKDPERGRITLPRVAVW